MYVADVAVKSSPTRSIDYKAFDEDASPLIGALIAILVILFIFLLIAATIYLIGGQLLGLKNVLFDTTIQAEGGFGLSANGNETLIDNGNDHNATSSSWWSWITSSGSCMD